LPLHSLNPGELVGTIRLSGCFRRHWNWCSFWLGFRRELRLQGLWRRGAGALWNWLYNSSCLVPNLTNTTKLKPLNRMKDNISGHQKSWALSKRSHEGLPCYNLDQNDYIYENIRMYIYIYIHNVCVIIHIYIHGYTPVRISNPIKYQKTVAPPKRFGPSGRTWPGGRWTVPTWVMSLTGWGALGIEWLLLVNNGG
jgi:hypothetical protein